MAIQVIGGQSRRPAIGPPRHAGKPRSRRGLHGGASCGISGWRALLPCLALPRSRPGAACRVGEFQGAGFSRFRYLNCCFQCKSVISFSEAQARDTSLHRSDL